MQRITRKLLRKKKQRLPDQTASAKFTLQLTIDQNLISLFPATLRNPES